MNRIKVPSGSKLSIFSTFENLQDQIASNIKYRFLQLFFRYGAINNTYAATQTTDTDAFEVSLNLAGSFQRRFEIQLGEGATESGELVRLDSTILVKHLDSVLTALGLSIQPNSYYMIKLRWKLAGTEPLTVMDGFRYDPGDPESVQNYSKYVDDIEVIAVDISSETIDTYLDNVTVDEFPLAILKTNASSNLDSSSWVFLSSTAVDGVIDLRGRVSLKINPKLLPDDYVLMRGHDYTGVNSIIGTFRFVDLEANQFSLIDINNSGNSFVFSPTLSGWSLAPVSDNHDLTINTSAGIQLAKFDFYNQKLVLKDLEVDNDIYVAGRKVMVEPTVNSGLSPSILNFHIEEIRGAGLSASDVDPSIASKMSLDAGFGGYSNLVAVKFKWNYDAVTGTGGINEFNAYIETGVNFAANELNGYFLEVPSHGGINLSIFGNDATTVGGMTKLYVAPPAGGVYNGSLYAAVDALNPAKIHSNADRYQLVAVPERNSTIQMGEIENVDVISPTSTTEMEKTLYIKNGLKYRYRIRAAKGMGYFTSDYTPWVSYPTDGSAELLQVPNITDDGEIGAYSTRSGFAVTIGGWTAAEKFEVCYSADAVPDFSNSNHPRVLSSARVIEVQPGAQATYKIKVRPLIAGQQVITDAEVASHQVSVSAGGSGNLPTDQVIIDQEIRHYVFNIVADNRVGDKVYFQSMTGPSGESITDLRLPSDAAGSILDVEGREYLIKDIFPGGVEIGTLPLNTAIEVPLWSGAFCYVGISKRGRRVIRTKEFSIDYELVSILVDSHVHYGDDITLRVYQEGREEYADSLIITGEQMSFRADGDVKLLSLFGDRNLIVDLWDPDESSPKNTGSLVARVTVYARPNPPKKIMDIELARVDSPYAVSTNPLSTNYPTA